MTSFQKTANKTVVMLYYCQILDSIFLSTCFISISSGLLFLFVND